MNQLLLRRLYSSNVNIVTKIAINNSRTKVTGFSLSHKLDPDTSWSELNYVCRLHFWISFWFSGGTLTSSQVSINILFLGFDQIE